MPIRKFRSVEEMTPLPNRCPFDPENLRIAIAWSRATLALHPRKRTSGVRRYRSYEEMKASDDISDARSTHGAETESPKPGSPGSEDPR